MTRDQKATATAQLAEYGYALDGQDRILTPKRRTTRLYVQATKGGIYNVHHDRGANAQPPKELIWSGPNLGKFLEAYWYAKKRPAP